MKCFLFDLDDTLYDLEHPFILAYKEIFKYIPDNIHDIFLAFRRYNNEIYDKALNGEVTMEYLCIYRIKNALHDFGIYIDDNRAIEFQLTYLRQKEKINLDENMKLVLSLLKNNGNIIGIISNGPHKEQYEKFMYLDLEKYISKDFIFVSEDIGFHKPDSKIFDYAMNKVKSIYPDYEFEFYYIGDSFEIDVIGGLKSGMKTFWINKRNFYPNNSFYVPNKEFKNTYDFKTYIQSEIK